MAIKEFVVLLAPHQSVEGMGIALDRSKDVLNHRFNRLRRDRLAQSHFKEHPGYNLAAAIGRAVGMSELARRGLRGGGTVIERGGRAGGNEATALRCRLGCGDRAGSCGRRITAPDQHVAPFGNIDHDRVDIGIAQVFQRGRIIENELGLPERVLEPAAFQLVHEHAHFDLRRADPL